MEGILLKWVNFIFGWRERYFVLKGSVLYYYYKKGEKPKGKIHLAISQLIPTNDLLKFKIETGLSKIYIKAPSVEIKEQWIKAINIAKFDGNSINSSYKNLNKLASETQHDEVNENTRKFVCNENSCTKENKLIKKLKKISKLVENLCQYNTRIMNILYKSDYNNSDVMTLLKENNNNVKIIQERIDKFGISLKKFNNDFLKFTEQLFTFKSSSDEDTVINKYINNNVGDSVYFDCTRRGYTNIQELKKDEINKSIFSKSKSKRKIMNGDETFKQNISKFPQKNYARELDGFYSASDSYDFNINHEDSSNILQKIKLNNDKYSNRQQDDFQIILKTDKLNLESPIFKNKFYDPIYNNKRFLLPVKKKQMNFNIWNIVKDAVGKDLSKFCVPVYLNEPLSMLQRLCENFQYADLLNRAANEENKYIRLCLIGAFCIAGFAIDVNRVLKFFNPLLSETYEYIDNEKNFRFFAEQVSHHPTISACYAEGQEYTYYTNSNMEPKIKLMNGCMEIHPMSKAYINLLKFDETITYTKPIVSIKNILLGKMFIDLFGKFVVTNTKTGDACEIEIFEKNEDTQGKLSGVARDIYGNIMLNIEGNWLSHMDVIDLKTGFRETLWTNLNIVANGEENFYFSDFTIELNNLTEEMKSALPPSDSRFRPDQRLLELQDYESAAVEKHRLEEKQRNTKKEREKKKIKYKPIYFEETYDDLSGEVIYVYNGGYFEDRKSKNFNKFYDIF